MQKVISGLAESLKAENEAFETLRSDMKKENSELASSIDTKLEQLKTNLAMENEVMDQMASKTIKLQVLKADLKHTTAVLTSAMSQNKALRSCASNIDSFLRRIIEEDDPILTPDNA